MPKILVGGGEPFSVSLISGTEKVWIRGGGRGSIKIFRRSFCLTVPKHFIGKHFGVVSEKFFYRKFSCIGGAGGITVVSELFVSQHRNEKLCKGTLLFSGNFLVSKKNLWIRGGISRFSVENFLSHSAENLRGHPLNVSENLGYRKILCIIGGITIFRRKFFVSQCRKNSWASFQCFRKFGVSKKFKHNRGYHNFPSKIFCLSAEKFPGHPFNVSENLGYRKSLCIIGGITILRRKFFVSQCRKIW